MKTKLTILLLLAFSVPLYFLSSGSSFESGSKKISPSLYTGGGDNFLIGAFNSGYDFLFEYDSLQFNVWHTYGFGPMSLGSDGRHYRPGWQHHNWVPGDTRDAGYGDYVPQIKAFLDAIPTDKKAYLTRPKIEWLRCGQRSDYQCEDTVYVNPDLWFYTFNDHLAGGNWRDNSQYGNNEYVRRCLVDQNQTDGGANWVVKRLKANSEQGLPYGDDGPFGDNECRWFIKPRIRIDSTEAHNNGNALVCKVKVIDQTGNNTLKEVDIKAVNFINPQTGNYGGEYIEEFYSLPLTDSLAIQGKWGQGLLFESRGTCETDPAGLYDKADIQVYWYGQCNMWIDYVRVDNDIANDLFSTDPNNTRHNDYMNWLAWEGEIAKTAPSYRFYIELFEFNNIPCLEYIFQKLDSITGGTVPLVACFTPHLYAGHVPWRDRNRVFNPEQFKRNFLAKTGAKEIMIAPYPFTSAYRRSHDQEPYPYIPTWSKLPGTLYDTQGP